MSFLTESKVWNLANIVTTFRLIVAPIFIGLFVYVYKYGHETPALVWTVAILYMVAAASDKLDGYWARKYDLITTYGKIVDPIADKFLVLGGFFALSYSGLLPWFFTIIVALRDFGITALRFALLKDIVIAASDLGKWKTVAQMFLIFLFVFPFYYFIEYTPSVFSTLEYVYFFFMCLALALTIFSFIDYLVVMRKALKEAKLQSSVAVVSGVQTQDDVLGVVSKAEESVEEKVSDFVEESSEFVKESFENVDSFASEVSESVKDNIEKVSEVVSDIDTKPESFVEVEDDLQAKE